MVQYKKTVMFLLIGMSVGILPGCSFFSSREVTVSPASESQKSAYLRFGPENADDLSFYSENFLRSNNLYSEVKSNPAEVLRNIDEFYKISPGVKYLFIGADICRWLALQKNTEEALPYHLTSMSYSCRLRQEVVRKEKSPAMDQFSLDFNMAAQSVKSYNAACSGIFRYLQEKNLIDAHSFSLYGCMGEKYTILEPLKFLGDMENNIVRMELCSSFRVKDLRQKNMQPGIGVPLVGWVGSTEKYKSIRLMDNMTIPITFAIRVGLEKNQDILLTPIYQDVALKETLETEIMPNGKKGLPLSLDFSTPLACFLDGMPEQNLLGRMLFSETADTNNCLYMMEPYSPHKIPLVFVHGLMSSPGTWIQTINALKSDPVIRQRYQIWFYSYFSGCPIFYSASVLRHMLQDAEKEFCTTQEATENFNRMVLVGHSMGGMISRMQLQEDPYFIAETILESPWKQIVEDLSEEDRKAIEDIVVQTPLPFIHRVVFMAVPHRGAAFAKRPIADLGIRLIRLPGSLITVFSGMTKQLLIKGKKLSHLEDLQNASFTGIDNLKPDNRFVKAFQQSKMKKDLVVHCIMGNVEKDNEPGGSDGIVPYSSSHLDCAVSELIVKSGHNVQRHPMAIRELLRILLLHLQELEQKK